LIKTLPPRAGKDYLRGKGVQKRNLLRIQEKEHLFFGDLGFSPEKTSSGSLQNKAELPVLGVSVEDPVDIQVKNHIATREIEIKSSRFSSAIGGYSPSFWSWE
jgi:hypothetical protein